MAERPLYTLYKNLKAQNYDVPDDYNKFESALTRDGKGGADNRHAIYENLKAQNFDVPSTYERFYSALFEPRSRTSSRAKGGSVPMSAADRARFSAGAAAISASAQQTMNNAGRYNRLKQRKQKQQKDFGRVNLGTHQTPYGGDANNVVKDDFAYNPETGKAGAYVTSDNENVYSQNDAEQKQAILDQQNNAYQEAVDTGEIPSAFDVRDKNGNYDLQENIGKNGTYLTEEGAQKQFDKKLADAYARKKEIEALIAEDNRQHGNPLLSYGASIGASNGRTAEQSDYRNKLATSLSLVTEQIGALEAVKQYPTSSWGEDALKALDNTAFTAKTWDFGLTDFATMGQMERIKTKMDNKIPLSGSDKMLLKSKLGADAAAALEDEKMGNVYRWTKIAGQSLPFMADFFLTGGYGGITKGISRGALKFAAKRGMGKVSAAILKNTGIVAGDVIGSYAMAGTEQALKTGADIMQRHLGNLYQDEKGDYKFGTFDENGNLLHEGGESMGTALYKGLTSAMVENYTEKLFGHNYGIKKGAVNFMEKHGMNASAEFFKNIGKSGWYTNSRKWMEKFGINGFGEEVMEEEIGIPLHALLDGDNKFSDLLDTKQQLDIIGGMAISVGSMYAMGAGSRPVKGIYNRAQYYRFRNKVNVADSDAQNLMGDNWADIKDKIDNATNEQMGGVLADILRQRDTMTKEQINAAVNYGVNLMKMRGYNIAKTAEMNAREITNEPTTPEEQHQADIDNAYSEGHDAADADKHDIQIQQEDQMKTLAAALGISEQQLSAMSDEELESLTGQDDKLDQSIYDYQLSSARYQGVVDDAQDKVDLAAHQAEQRVDMYTDQSRGSVRNATIKASGGLEDYGVYIISGNVATHDDGSIDVSNSDDMILYYDPTTNSVEHADALMFAELGEELPADEVKAQAVADAKENAIKEVAGIIDGTVEVGSQFNVTDTDGTEHTYEVLADYGDGTAAISIDGNVVENPYSLADLQQMKDLEDQKRLEAAKAEREQMEKERADQQAQETEETQPSFDFNQILNDNGNVVLVDVLDKDGNTKYPDSRLFLIRDAGAKAKVVELKSDGTFVPHAVNKEDVATISSMSLDEYKQAMPESSMIEDNSGQESDEDSQLANLGLPKGSEIWMSGDGFGRPKENTLSKVVGIDEQGSIILEDKDGKKWSASFDYINNHRELPPLDENANIVNEENNQSESNAEENTPAPEQTPAMTLEDGTIVPMLEDGNPDFSKLTAEQTAELYDTQFGEDADSVISNWVSEAKKALDKANNMAVKGKTFVEQKAAKDAKEKAIADAQAAYDSAIAIRDAYNERQLAKVEDTAEGRKNLIDKARRKFARLKSAVKDDAEAVSQLYRDTIGSLLHRLYDSTGIDVTDTTPLTAEEYVASNLGAHSLNYEGTETSKGVKQETGLGREDFAKTQLLAADGKGTTIDSLVHSLWENRPSNLESLDTQDIRNALIGVLNSGFKASEARNFVENIRIAQAENILEEQKRAQENAAYAEQQKAEQEAELKAKSDEKAELKAKSEAKLDNESDNKSNDLSNETDNEKINDNINDNINVPEDATDENPLGAERDESDLPFSAKENGKQQTTAERAADVEKNKVDDMKVVDNIVGEKTRKAFERLAKMMGANIQWQYSDKLGNGWIQETTDADGNVHRTIFITLDSSITEGAQFIFGHEMTHQIKNLNPAVYNELTQLVLDTYGSDAFDKAVDETMKRYSDAGFSGRARDYYAEEVVADSVGEMIRDLNLAHTLAMKMSHPLLAAIHEILQKIKLAFFGTEYSDVTKNIIRSIEQAYVKTANGQVTNSETGEDVSFSLRQKPEPKKKGVGYKVFVLKDGKLYPPMVANPDGAATPVGVWLDADAAPIAGESKTGRPQVKQGGKGTQGGSGKLAYRPGWHLGVVPYAIQFNRKDAEGNKTLFPKNFVFAEVEYAADVDYQEEARQEGINPSGKYQHSLAGLKHLPTDGYYMYRTNPNPETDPWVITGAMKVNRILTRAEQAELVKNAGREPQQIQEGDIVTDDVVNSINQEIADAPKFSLKVYHGSGADFTEFDFDHMGEGAGSQVFGWGGYVTSSKKIGKSYANLVDANAPHQDVEYVGNNAHEYTDVVAGLFNGGQRDYDDVKEFLQNGYNSDKGNARKKQMLEWFESTKPSDWKSVNDGKRNLYEVDIPEDNGSNYLEWEGDVPSTLDKEKLAELILDKTGAKEKVARFKATPAYLKGLEFDIKKLINEAQTGQKLYTNISSFVSEKDASKILSALGYTGIKYPAGTIMGGAEEGDTNYVIFKPEDMRITEHTKFSLKTYHGTGANFDRFDTSHAYEGAGSETFGHGIYVTKSAKIGASYALKAKVKKIKTPKAFKAIKNGDNWFGRFIDNAVRSSFAKAKRETFNRMDELIKEDENIVNDETKPEWKQNAAQKELADFDKLKSLFEGLTEEDIPSLKRAKANRYEVEIPDDTGNNYLDWNKPMKKEQKKIVREGLEKLGVDVDRLVRNGYSLDKNFGDVYNGLLYYALNGTKFEERDSFVASSNFLSSLGFTGIKYYAGTIWGGAKKGDLNYVIFNEDDAKIVGNTKFSLKSKPVRFEAGKKLSDEEKKEVLSTLKDAYKVNGVPYHIEETAGGKEKRVYEPTADSYVVSDITNRPLRYYITLPDGRVAHPTEVYPNISDNEVKSSATKQGLLEEEVDQILSAAIDNLKNVADKTKAVEVLTELQNLPHETHDVGYGLNHARSYNYKTGIFTSSAAQAIDYVVRRMRRKEDVPAEIPAALKKAVADSYGMVDNLIDGMSSTKFSLKDNQGNPLNQDGTLKLDKIKSVDELTDEDFLHPTRNVELPSLPKKIADAIGTEGKPVVIKKNIFERNYMRHKDVTPELSKVIFKSALYNPDLYGQNQKKTRPYNWVLINTKDEKGNNRTILLEVNPNKDNVEIVHWHFVNDKNLGLIKKQAIREGDQVLILPSEQSEEVGGLSNLTDDLSAAKIDNSSETTKENGEKVDVEAPKTFDEFLNHPSLKFSIKNEQQRKAAEDAYEYASKLRPNKTSKYALVDMNNPSSSPEYYEKKVLADRWRRFYNKAVHNELDDVYKAAWGNYKLFDLDRPFADQVNEVKGDVPNEFNAPDVVANKNADNESGAEYHEYKQDEQSSITYKDRYKAFKQRVANSEKVAGLKKKLKETEDSYNSKSKERAEYNKQLMKEYMDKHKMTEEYEIPDDDWDDLRSKSFEKYQDELDSLFNKYKDLDRQIKAVAEPRFSLKDEKTLAGVHNITEEKLRKALKLGGFANPSLAVIDTSKSGHDNFGEISFIAPSALLDKRTGKTGGTWITDAYTQRYPSVEREMSEKGSQKFRDWVDSLEYPSEAKAEIKRQAEDALSNNNAPAWELMYLKEKGIDIKEYDSRIDYRWKEIIRDHPTAEDILSSMQTDPELNEKVTSLAKHTIIHPTWEKVSLEVRRKMYKETGVKASPINPQVRKQTKEIFERDYAPTLLDKDGKPKADDVKKVVEDIVKEHNDTKKYDFYLSKVKASNYVNKNGLYDDYIKWQENKLDEFGTKNRIFRGYTKDGSRKYVPETLENVSKAMREEADGQTNGSEYTSFGSFIAKLADRVDSTDEMRANKDKLSSNEDKEEFYEKWSDVYYDLAKFLYNDVFYGEQRLHDIVLQSDPKKYAKKEYGITLTPTFMKKLDALKNAVQTELKSAYFETKYNRPLRLNEFAAAVVPDNLGEDVRKGIENAGLPMYDYDPNKEGDRSRAFNEAINSSDNIRFSLKAMMEKPEGWKQANKKAIHIAEAIERDPKFSLKNLDGTLIKAGTYFSGGGLVEEGLKGIIDPVIAVEYDEKISGVYRNNFGQHIVTADVRDVDPKELVKQIDGEVEYFHASPVCKNYSQAKSNHAEVELDKETAASTAEFINAVKPKVVTIENVKGYKDSDAMKTITDALDANGYTWDADVYNAADYGGYTNRERLIVRAVRDGKLPEKPKKMAHKSGWYEAVADIIPTLTEKKNGVAPWMDIRLKADGIDWRNIDKPLYVMGSAYADGKIPHAFADELLPTLRTKSGDVIVMPDGKVYRAMGRVLARVSGVSDDYKMPFSENLSHTIIGNGIPTQLTEHVIAPLLTGSDPKFSIRTYHGTGASFDKFDFSHMGEGEGSQAFGWGGYVTNSKDIAEDYTRRAKIRKDNGGFEFVTDMSANNKDMVRQYIYKHKDVNKGLDAMRKDLSSALEMFPDDDDLKELSNILAKKNEEIAVPDNIAYLYDVDIPDDNGDYLDWENKLKKSHLNKVNKELVRIGKEPIETIYPSRVDGKVRGQDLYDELSSMLGSKESASKLLSDAGFVGIKYPAGTIFGGAKEDDYNYVIFDENNANIVGNTRFSLRYDQFEHDLNQWKKDNNLPKDAQRPTIPQRNAGESAVDFLRRVDEYRKQMALWKTAPTYEQHLLSDDTALGEFNRELQRGSVLKRIAFQDSMLAIRKAQEAIMKEVGVDRLNMAEDAYTAENRSHGKGKNEFEEYNNEFLQPLRKAYHQMKKILGDSYDNVRIYMMAKHGLERDAQMAFKKSLEADYEDVAQRSAAYKAYKGDMNRIINDSDLEFGRVDFNTWRQRDNALRTKYSPSYMDYRYDENGIAYDYSGLSALFGGSDFEEAAHKLVRDIESSHVAEVQDLWNATNSATKKILRDGYKAGMMSKDAYQYVRDMYSHYIPLRGWDGTTADQVWDYVGGGNGAFNQTLKTAHGRTSIADDPIAYIENMAESGILLNNKNWVKQHLMLLAQNHPTSLLTLSKAWYVKSTDANGNEEWIPATPQITSQMDSNQVKTAIDAFEKKMEQMAQAGDATQKRDGLNIAYPQTHSEEREHEVRVMKDGEEYVIYVNGDPQLAQAMNNTRAHRLREIQSGKLDKAAAWLGRKMAAAYTSLSPLFIPSNYFRDLTMTLASTAIREDGKYNYLLRKNLATSWNLGFMLRDYQNGKLREKVINGNATPKEQMFYDFMMNGGETGFVSSLDVEDLKKKFKNDLKDLDRWKANPVKVGHTIMDSIEFLNRAIEDSNRFAVYMTSIQYGRSIDEAVNDAKDVTLNFNRKGTGEYGWQMIRNLYLFINPAVQSLQTLGALAKHHPFKFTAVTASWLVSGLLVPIVNAALMSLFGGDDDKDKYWQFTKWDRRNNLIMWVPYTHEYVKIPLAQEFRAFYGIGDMIASKMMGGELAEESWSQYAEDLLGQVVDMLPLDPTGYDGNIAVSLMPNPIRPIFELAFNVDFTGKPLFKDTEYNKYDPNFTKAYVGTPDWLVRASKMVNSIGNDYPDVQQNSIDAFGDPRYNLNNPAVVDHVLSSYLGGAYTIGSQVLGVLTKSLNDPKEIKVADIPLFSKFVSNPDDRPVTKKQGDEFWSMKENHDRAANTLSKLKKQAKVDGDYSMLERFYGSEEYKQYKQDDVNVKKYEEDKKKERAEENGEEYRPHKLNAEDIYKAHATPKDDFEDLKLKQLYTKLNGFKTSYDLLVDTAPSQSDGYYNTNKAAIDAIDEISIDKQEISELKKGFLDDGKDAYNAEDMKQIRDLRKKILAVLEKANKVVVANQKAKTEK
jgi:site-specific DNA-cytosine methylase